MASKDKIKDPNLKQPRYVASTRVAKAKSTRGGEYLVKENRRRLHRKVY
jgi:hypothetical protein